MRFGVMLPHGNAVASPQAIVEVAQAAEALDFHSVVVRDHLVYNGAYVVSGTADSGGEQRLMFEALETLTYVAGLTSRVRLGTSVIILPNRHPLLFAKQAASLDVLSGGRLTLGFGVGPNRRETAADTTKLGTHRANLEKEYDAFGAHGPRGPRMEEYFQALVALWTEDRASYDGRYVRFEDVEMFPKPLQRPHPPIRVGGRADAALRRAARWGAGWCPSQVTSGEIAAGAARLAELRDGGDRQEIGINVHAAIADSDGAAERLAAHALGAHFSGREELLARTIAGDVDTVIRRVAEYRDAGVDYIELKPVYGTIAECVALLQRVHDEVMPAFRPAARA